MKVGDSKKVIVLSIIAVVVLTVAVVRSIPMGELAVQVISALRQGDEQGGGVSEDLSTTVHTNPFYHPKLAVKEEKTTSEPPPAETGSTAKPLPNWSGTLPPTGPLIVKPEEVAGASQQSIPEPKTTTVAIEAVLQASEMAAMIAIGEGPARMYRKGEKIATGIRLVEITSDGVVLRTPKGRTSVAVGKQVEL